mmetsp:Transcript_1709/g.2687  ORF Transcript_1709/g.2687 Transcript_1709/m.2687 type:complete len:149 (+) Transcript_1709:55-501(+)
MTKNYRTPSGRRSSYRYQYEDGQDIVKGHIVSYKETNFVVLFGNGLDKENPCIEVRDIMTRESKRLRAKAITLVCEGQQETCECEHHKLIAAWKTDGDFGSNIVEGTQVLEIPELEDNTDLKEMIEQLRKMTVANRNKVKAFMTANCE